VVPTLKVGDPTVLVCPACGHEAVTPVSWNPWTLTTERMILIADRTARCPHCGAVHWILPDVARRHNAAIYPHNPEVWEQPADLHELN
jgi:predicted RNA-binding Zn-ribbon protein involved in translation (DUF1610 family)